MLSNRPTSEQFTIAVKEFEEKHGTKIHEFLVCKRKYRSCPPQEDKVLVEKFFTHPVIHNYLSRKTDTIEFLENTTSDSDFTPIECEIYALRDDMFPFRENVDNSKFYSQGANSNISDPRFFLPLQILYNNQNLHITQNMDIYEVRKYLNEHAYLTQCPGGQNREKFKFILTPNWKDGHATVMLHILNPATGEVMASVLINSWNSEHYKDDLCVRFNKKKYYNLDQYNYEMKNIENAPNRKSITEREILFLDASHHLQTDEGDKNCTLYGYNFIQAIAEMLNDPMEADRIFNLATLAHQKNSDAQAELSDIFKEKLKEYLPYYYNNKEKTAPADLRKFHLMERWNLGSRILSTAYPPEAVRIKKEKVQCAFDSVISILEKEKIRLIRKYPQHKIERLIILNRLIYKARQELVNFKNYSCSEILDFKLNLQTIITTELKSGALDKYHNWAAKLFLCILNALSFLTSPAKKLITGSWFFSLEGKTQEAARRALTEIKSCQTAEGVI